MCFRDNSIHLVQNEREISIYAKLTNISIIFCNLKFLGEMLSVYIIIKQHLLSQMCQNIPLPHLNMLAS